MTNQPQTALEQDFAREAANLRSALNQASDAINAIEALLPSVGGIAGALAQLDAALQSARQQTGLASNDGGASSTAAFSRPTLVVPAAASGQPAIGDEATAPFQQAAAAADVQRDANLTAFRLEFESKAGPLDLRAVDEAVSEHPAVRDVALLDYDGRHASLKVWIDPSASPAEIKDALVERAESLFGDDNDVTIIALEDAA
jgi:hypothetical protein